MTGEVLFHGNGPFELPQAQTVTAATDGHHVCLSFSILVGEMGEGRLVTLKLPLTTSQSYEICAELSRAAARATLPHEPPPV